MAAFMLASFWSRLCVVCDEVGGMSGCGWCSGGPCGGKDACKPLLVVREVALEEGA